MNTHNFLGYVIHAHAGARARVARPAPSQLHAESRRPRTRRFARELSAAAASAPNAGGASIAAHADHLRYGIALLNRWARGEAEPWKDADWTASWKKGVVTEAEWRALRDDLRRETDAWVEALAVPREVKARELAWIAGSVAHLAYHLGAIRQIDRATRGPTAEDERRAEEG